MPKIIQPTLSRNQEVEHSRIIKVRTASPRDQRKIENHHPSKLRINYKKYLRLFNKLHQKNNLKTLLFLYKNVARS